MNTRLILDVDNLDILMSAIRPATFLRNIAGTSGRSNYIDPFNPFYSDGPRFNTFFKVELDKLIDSNYLRISYLKDIVTHTRYCYLAGVTINFKFHGLSSPHDLKFYVIVPVSSSVLGLSINAFALVVYNRNGRHLYTTKHKYNKMDIVQYVNTEEFREGVRYGIIQDALIDCLFDRNFAMGYPSSFLTSMPSLKAANEYLASMEYRLTIKRDN